MKVKCLNCGHEFETTEIEEDNLGLHCICEECGASFDVDIDEIVEEKWKPHLIGGNKMECPMCKNTIGFNCGTCIECGYNYLKHDFEFIKVNVDILENIVPENILEELLYQHQKYVSKWKSYLIRIERETNNMKNFDPIPYINRNEEAARQKYGEKLDEDRRVKGTKIWFDGYWRFHISD